MTIILGQDTDCLEVHPDINIIGWNVTYDDGTTMPDPPNSVRLRGPPDGQAAVMRQVGMCIRFAGQEVVGYSMGN